MNLTIKYTQLIFDYINNNIPVEIRARTITQSLQRGCASAIS